MAQGILQFRTLKVQILKVLTLCQSAKVEQHYHDPVFLIFSQIPSEVLIFKDHVWVSPNISDLFGHP